MSKIEYFSWAYALLAFISFVLTFIRYRKVLSVSEVKVDYLSLVLPILITVGVGFIPLGLDRLVVIPLALTGLLTGVIWKVLKSRFTATVSGFGRLYSFSFIHLITSVWFLFVFANDTINHFNDQLPLIYAIFLTFLYLSSWIKIGSTENSHHTFGDWVVPLLFLIFLMVMPLVEGEEAAVRQFVFASSAIWLVWNMLQLLYVQIFEWLKNNKIFLFISWVVAAGIFVLTSFYEFQDGVSFTVSGLMVNYDIFYQIGVMAAVLFPVMLIIIWVSSKVRKSQGHDQMWESLPIFVGLSLGTYASYILGAEFGLFVFALSVSVIILPFQNAFTGRIVEKLIFFIVTFIILILVKKETGVSALDFSKPQVIIAISAGSVLMLWLNAIENNQITTGWRRKFGNLTFLMLSFMILTASGYLVFIHESLGGGMVLGGVLAGIGLTLMLYPTSQEFEFSKLNWLFVWALIIAPHVKIEDLYADKKSSKANIEGAVTNESGDVVLQNKDLAEVSGNWTLDAEFSSLGFTIMSQGDETKGVFKKFRGSLNFKEDWKSTEFTIKIEAASINTSNSIRDESLRGDAEFFEVEKYPEIVYTTEKVEKSDTAYIAKGTLTMKDVTKEIDLPFKYLGKGQRDGGKEFLIFEGGVKIDRSNFGMEPASSISNDVNIRFEAEFVKD